MLKLFKTIKIKNLELKNRVVMPSMCMYCAEDDGIVTPWHVTHYETRAVGGVGLIMLEATAVEPSGRISAKDLGIWSDDHIEGLKKIVDRVHKSGAKIGIQLAHSGRKCESLEDDIYAPSPISYSSKYREPKQMTIDDINRVKEAFKNAAERAEKAGFDTIEIHGAHGYLINQFLSPLTNKRDDEYGGSLEKRSRFLKEVLEEVHTVWPKEKPTVLRVSSLEYSENGNFAEDISQVINLVKEIGIDIVNVSSGGVINAGIDTYPGYQIEPAHIIKKNTDLATMAGGLITNWELSEEILNNDRADLIYMGRKLLRDPYYLLTVAQDLNLEIPWPKQYERARL